MINIKVLFLSSGVNKSGVANSLIKLRDSFKKIGVSSALVSPQKPEEKNWKYYKIPYVKTWNFWTLKQNKKIRKRLNRIIKNFKPDIIHVHNINGLSLEPLWIAKKKNIPIIITLRDYYWLCGNSLFWKNSISGKSRLCDKKNKYECFKCGLKSMKPKRLKSIPISLLYGIQNIKRLKMKKYLNLFDKVVCITQFQKELFNLNNSVLIYNMHSVKKVNKHEKPPYKEYYITGGRIREYKGFQTAIKAFIKMPTKNLVICGDGEYKKKLLRLANKAENIKFYDFLDQRTFLKLTKSSKGLIVPSLWYEGCPNVIIDAYHLRVPVIGSRIGSIKELIKEGKTGFLFKPGDADDLAKKIRKVDRLKPKWDSSKKLLSFFKPQRVAKNYKKVYNKVLK